MRLLAWLMPKTDQGVNRWLSGAHAALVGRPGGQGVKFESPVGTARVDIALALARRGESLQRVPGVK